MPETMTEDYDGDDKPVDIAQIFEGVRVRLARMVGDCYRVDMTPDSIGLSSVGDDPAPQHRVTVRYDSTDMDYVRVEVWDPTEGAAELYYGCQSDLALLPITDDASQDLAMLILCMMAAYQCAPTIAGWHALCDEIALSYDAHDL